MKTVEVVTYLTHGIVKYTNLNPCVKAASCWQECVVWFWITSCIAGVLGQHKLPEKLLNYRTVRHTKYSLIRIIISIDNISIIC